jgi:integrase
MPKAKGTKEIKRWVTLPDGQRERRSFYGATVEEAEAKWRDAERPPIQGDWPTGSFGWLVETKWIPLKAHLEGNSQAALQFAIRHTLLEVGDVPIERMDATEITRALNRIKAHRKTRTKTVGRGADAKTLTVDEGPIAPSSVNKCRGLMIEVVSLGHELDLCRAVNARRVPRQKEDAPDIKPYSPREMRLLLDECRGSVAFAPVLFAMFAGLTINEARALRREDLDPDGVLQAKWQMKRTGERSRNMKTQYRPRPIPLPPGLLEEVVALASEKGSPWLCRGAHGGQVNEGTIDRSLNPKMRRCGLHHLTVHQLRHSFSAWLDDSGCPAGIRLKLLGQSRKAVRDRYTHADLVKMRRWLGLLWDASLEKWEDGTRPDRQEGKPGPKNPATGSRNGRAVLSDEDVREIRAMLAAGELTPHAIGKAYGVDPKAIRQIQEGKTWRGVGDEDAS